MVFQPTGHPHWLGLLTAFLLAASRGSLAQQQQQFSGCSIDEYYQPLITKFGNDTSQWVRSDIEALLQQTHRRVLPYTDFNGGDDVWKALIDLDPGPQPNTVTLIYRNVSMPAEPHGTSNTWNREHLWPTSRGVGTSGAAHTDIHHLRPADTNVNSARSNLSFGSCGLVQPLNTCTIPATPETGRDTAKDISIFEPPVIHRGNVARALFYMELRYFGSDPAVPKLELTDCPSSTTNNHVMAYLSQLLQWHMDDPVDDEERNRNNQACTRWQGNRNIFVDYPELVSQLYGPPKVATGPPYGYSYCQREPQPNSPVPSWHTTQAPSTDTAIPRPTDHPHNAPTQATTERPTPAPTIQATKHNGIGATSCTDLSPGDIQVVGINSDNPDIVILLTLEDLPGGMAIYMTDNAWTGEEFQDTEGTIQVRNLRPFALYHT